LASAIDRIDRLATAAGSADPRVSDALTLGRAVAHAALIRRESRGSHFRRDFPALDPYQSSRSFVGLTPEAAIAASS
jgi:L-aspartate oxidase